MRRRRRRRIHIAACRTWQTMQLRLIYLIDFGLNLARPFLCGHTCVTLSESEFMPKITLVLQSDTQRPFSLTFFLSWCHLHWTLSHSMELCTTSSHSAWRLFPVKVWHAGQWLWHDSQRHWEGGGWWLVSSGDCHELVTGCVSISLEVVQIESENRKYG